MVTSMAVLGGVVLCGLIATDQCFRGLALLSSHYGGSKHL